MSGANIFAPKVNAYKFFYMHDCGGEGNDVDLDRASADTGRALDLDQQPITRISGLGSIP